MMLQSCMARGLQYHFLHRPGMFALQGKRFFSQENEDINRQQVYVNSDENDETDFKTLAHSHVRSRFGNFVDVVEITVRGGKGGNGNSSFARDAFVQRGVRSGTSGTPGGDVFIEASMSQYCLRGIRSSYNAPHGRSGLNNAKPPCIKDLVITVPLGTVVTEAPPDETKLFYDKESKRKPDLRYIPALESLRPKSLEIDKERLLVAQGGLGGLGNVALRVDNPPPCDLDGQPGEERRIVLELRSLADCGLVGLPNAGKSTLVNCLSNSNARVGNYAFTTVAPSRGTLIFSDHARLTIADLPGLIEGAHLGRGMGHEFLRHIERAPVLLYVIDISRPDPVNDIKTLIRELELHHTGLARRPSLVIANKADRSATARAGFRLLKEWVESQAYLKLMSDLPQDLLAVVGDYDKTWEVVPISAKYSVNIPALLKKLREISETHCVFK